jgi:hypothetical protein
VANLLKQDIYDEGSGNYAAKQSANMLLYNNMCDATFVSPKSNIMRKAGSKGISLNAFFKSFTSALRSLFVASDDDFMRLKKFIC